MKAQESKGIKNTSEFRRLQERQARIEKAEDEAARKGNFDNDAPMKVTKVIRYLFQWQASYVTPDKCRRYAQAYDY